MENWTESERDLKRAVELAPDEPVALNALGYRWAERGENLDQAFALINKAVDAEPQNGAFIDSLGWAYYQQADYENAATYLEKAAALEPADPTITDHLGDVYWRLERTLEARYQWSRALELEPTDKLAAAIAEKLKSGIREVETPKEDAR
jgi:Flp pilus assembly protein TadD